MKHRVADFFYSYTDNFGTAKFSFKKGLLIPCAKLLKNVTFFFDEKRKIVNGDVTTLM